ncbi:MAG: hypothetical protein M1829_004344 [Trizodia sp. TS-e1964]|nr:MAG: hypothetical protein M1829_004344 [Trizodia sp. TS-e1964]
MSQPTPLSLPALTPFTNVAAGHEGVLVDDSGEVVVKPCTTAEVAFYEAAHASHPAFAAYMPTLLGTLTLSPEGTSLPEAQSQATQAQDQGSPQAFGKHLSTNLSIVLSNATRGFHRPSILDLKLGSQLHDEQASPEKRARLEQVARETTSGSLGFRIAGMRVWRKDTASYGVFDKWYGRGFSAATVRQGFDDFFAGAGEPEVRKWLAERLRAEVEGFQRALEGEESRMIGASLLFVYEGDMDVLMRALEEEASSSGKEQEARQDDSDGDDGDEGSISETTKPRISVMKVIDFAHAQWTPGLGPDENCLQGIRNVVRILDQIIEGSSASNQTIPLSGQGDDFSGKESLKPKCT